MFASEQRAASDGAALKVLHVFQFFYPDFTGEGIYFQRLAPFLESEGIRNDVAVTVTEGSKRDERSTISEYFRHLNVRYFGNKEKDSNIFRFLIWLLFNVRRFEVVHVHAHPDRFFLTALIARLMGCRVIYSCTLEDSPAGLLTRYRRSYRPIVRLLMRTIHQFIAISPKLYTEGLSVVPVQRMVMVPQGVVIPTSSHLHRREWRQRYGFEGDEIILLWVGGICERKDVLFLIDNFAVLLGADPRLRFLIVGPRHLEPDYAAAVGERVRHLGLDSAVIFQDFLDDPGPVYDLADMFVFASRSEGFGNVLLEAMARGLPVVSRRIPGVTNYFIHDGENGFLFDKAEQYRAIVHRLASDGDLRARIGSAGKTFVEANLQMDVIARRYLDIYTS